MQTQLTRREMLRGSAAAVTLAFAHLPLSVFGVTDDKDATPVPFLDPQPINPTRRMVKWDALADWITPHDDFFTVSHYGIANVELSTWKLEITGLFTKPTTLTLEELKRRKRKEVTATLECSGNGSSPTFMGAVGNARWTGTPLASLLKDHGVSRDAVEIVFYGADNKTEKIREHDYDQNFARSISFSKAMDENVILAYEMNGKPLTVGHGAPLRLIVPGWYGIAWVKWITRIEARDRRFMSRFMARDYVTIRGEEVNGKTIWRETSVSLMNIKSLVGRVLRLKDGTLRVCGAAWSDGTPIKRVEFKIDDGPWQTVTLDQKKNTPYAWTFWAFDWRYPQPGEHTIVSRAIDAKGRVQPSSDDPEIKLKRTYWEANQQYPRKIKV